MWSRKDAETRKALIASLERKLAQGDKALVANAGYRRFLSAPTFNQFMGGLTTAMFLFLIASGLSLVFGVMRVINFAHGSFYMLGAYLAWQAVTWLQPQVGGFWLATLFAAGGVAVLGAFVERLFFRSLYGREELYQLLFTYALAHDSPHSQMAPNICAKRGCAASIWANRLIRGSRRKSVMFGMSS